MEYKSSMDAVKNYFVKYDPENINIARKFENRVNKKIEEDFTEKIKKILQEKLTTALT